MIKRIACLSFLAAFIIVSIGFAQQNKGAREMVLKGSEKNGDVPFPHHTHQTALNDCNKCHALFPQIPGAIEDLISNGKLLKKQVMNQCRTCHRETAKTGAKAGPVSCSKCHSLKK